MQGKDREILGTPVDVKGAVTLSLRQVIQDSMRSSDSFRRILAQAQAIPSDALAAEAITDAKLTATTSKEWNRNQSTSPYGTNSYDQTQATLGFEKYFRSGTALGLSLTEYRNNSLFSSTIGTIDSKSAGISLTLRQSLWRDFLGTSTRNQIKSGDLFSQANRVLWEAKVEDWALQLMNLYLRAWSLQRRLQASQKTFDRRLVLAQLFQRRQALGTSEEADRLQVEAALEQNRIQILEQQRDLQRIWENLIVTSKLPAEAKKVDPRLIPMEIDPVLPIEQLHCDSPPESTRALIAAELQSEAAHLRQLAASDRLRPNLTLNLGLATNRAILSSVDDFETRWSESFAAKYPAWTIGLQFEWSIDGSLVRSQDATARASAIELNAALSQEKDQSKLDFDSLCSGLQLQQRSFELYQKLESAQSRRVHLEEVRYRQARAQPFAVLQAGDEWYGTTVGLITSHSQWIANSYELKKAKGELYSILSEWSKEATGQSLGELSHE